MTTKTLILPDNRKLGYTITGHGTPIIYFHGTASSRLETLLLTQLTITHSLQLIGIDRPGYGLSTYKPRRNIQDFNPDVNALTQHLGFKQFGILGWSGGGAFALDYLAAYPERVTKAVTVAAPNLPFDVSTAHNNMPLARYIMKLQFAGRIAMRQLAHSLRRAKGDAAAFLATPQGKQLLHGCSASDLQFFSDPPWMNLMYEAMLEAFRQGEDGISAVLDEHQLFIQPWGISFTKVPLGKLVIWTGDQDKTCPVKNAYDLHKTVSSDLEIFRGLGHCAMFENLNKLGEILQST
jgi:pimeloyl-ACP methyl ester carboxylesterase